MAANGSVKAFFFVLTFHECRSVTIVQPQFRTKFGKQPPSDNSIRRWYTLFQETGCVCKTKRTGRPSVIEEKVEQVRQAFVRGSRMFVESQRVHIHSTCKVCNKNLEYIYSYLKCIVYDKLLKPRQSFRITLYIYIHIHTYIHTYIHTCIHTYIHTLHTYIQKTSDYVYRA